MGFLKDTFGGAGGMALGALAPGLQETAGLLGLGNKVGVPIYHKAELDPNANDILNQRAVNARMPANDYENQIADEQNAGVHDLGNLLDGGSADSPMRDAIEARQRRQFGSLENKMHRTSLSDAPAIRGQRMASTIGAIRNNSANAVAFAQKQKLAEQNKMFARNEVINSVFRNGGAIAGAVIGTYFGGPEGGKAGAAAGQGAGSAAGRGVGGETGQLQYI